MKRLTAILLLLLLLFNLLGYQAIFYLLQQRSDTRFLTHLDAATYKDEDLITLKIPLNLPYQNERPQFERVDGEITLEGKLYKYVKRKVEGGHLVLLCLPDKDKQQIKEAHHTFFKMVNDVEGTSKSSGDGAKSLAFKGLWSEYDKEATGWLLTPLTVVQTIYFSYNDSFKNPLLVKTKERPPDGLLG